MGCNSISAFPPSHAIGVSEIDGSFQWIVRLRNPFIVIRVGKLTSVCAALRLWPHCLENQVKHLELLNRLHRMLDYYRDFRRSEWPLSWSYEFSDARELPEFILLSNPVRKWVGVLALGDGSLWLPQAEGRTLAHMKNYQAPISMTGQSNTPATEENVQSWYARIVEHRFARARTTRELV